MTLKEFSDKYGVPYHTVYLASYKAKPISTARRDREYDARSLYKAVYYTLRERILANKKLVDRDVAILRQMKSVK